MATLQSSDMPEEKSLFDRVLEMKKSLSMSSELHRLILLVKLGSDKPSQQQGGRAEKSSARRKKEIGHFDGHAKRWRDGRRGDVLTGTMVYYPDYALCVLECTAETLNMAMLDIMDDERRQDFCVSAKLISYGSGIKCRLFKDWTSRIMPHLQTNVQHDLSVDPLSQNLPMLIDGIMKLSTVLVTFPRVDLSMHVDRLRENFSHLMIPNEHFEYLMREEGVSTISTYLERYRSRHEIRDDNERAWPVPALIRPPLTNRH